MAKKVFVRAHNRKWPLRWDLRRFIIQIGNDVYIVLARGHHDAERVFRENYRIPKHWVLNISTFTVERYLGLFPALQDNQILHLKEAK